MNRLIKLFFYKTSWIISKDYKNFSKVLDDGFVELNNNFYLKNSADPFPYTFGKYDILLFEKRTSIC